MFWRASIEVRVQMRKMEEKVDIFSIFQLTAVTVKTSSTTQIPCYHLPFTIASEKLINRKINDISAFSFGIGCMQEVEKRKKKKQQEQPKVPHTLSRTILHK